MTLLFAFDRCESITKVPAHRLEAEREERAEQPVTFKHANRVISSCRDTIAMLAQDSLQKESNPEKAEATDKLGPRIVLMGNGVLV